jgi:hypothetical protein
MTAAVVRGTAKVPAPRRSIENEPTVPIPAPHVPDDDVDALIATFDADFDTVYGYLYLRCGHHGMARMLATKTWNRAAAHLAGIPDGQHTPSLLALARAVFDEDIPGHPFRLAVGESDVTGDAEALATLNALRDLPPAQQEAVVLWCMFGLGPHEIATVLGIAPGSVRQTLRIAGQNLHAKHPELAS